MVRIRPARMSRKGINKDLKVVIIRAPVSLQKNIGCFLFSLMDESINSTI